MKEFSGRHTKGIGTRETETASLHSPRQDWIRFAALSFCFAFGFAIYGGIFQNFVRESLNLNPRQFGLLESLREVPGLLTAFTAGTLVALAEPRLAGYALGLAALGIGATGRMGGYWALVGITVLWSIGFHLWISVQPSITMALAEGREGGRRLGQMAGIASAATLAALGFSRVAKAFVSYQTLFYLAGASILAAGFIALTLSPRAHGGDRKRIVYRSEYRLYYVLTFLEGCRRQIFATFASFTLILVYHTRVETMLTLAFLNAGAAALAGPAIGRLMDRRGERWMMTRYYIALILVFTGYAAIRSKQILYGLYLTDSLLFTFSVGLTTYLHRIVRSGEMTPSLAMGTTMNHVAAVLVPALGGLLWQSSGSYQLPFWIGVGIVACSLAAAMMLPEPVVRSQV